MQKLLEVPHPVSGSILLIHPETDELDRIEALVQPLGRDIRRAVDLRGALELCEARSILLVVCTDIDVPEHKPQVVEEVRRVSSRFPVIVLVRDRAEECPKAARLLTGLQQYLVWPDEAEDLPGVARALLRTSRYLNGSQQDQLAAMRDERDARRLRETLSALRATGGNVSQAADILKMSRSGLNYRLKQLGLR